MPAPPHVSLPAALVAFGRSVGRFVVLLIAGRIGQPRHHLGGRITFANGASARVFRETVTDHERNDSPAVLVVEFRLRALHRHAHRWFQRASVVNTALFAGFPGFISKLWLTQDENEVYRGIYEWDGAEKADSYAQALTRLLALVSVPGSVAYHIVAGETCAQFLADSEEMIAASPPAIEDWRVS